MSKEILDVLSKSNLFSGFTQDQLEEVILHMNPKPVTLKNGERIYKKGDLADRCWLIMSGKLILKRPSLRSPFRHIIYNKGAVTGIQGLVDSGSTRVVSMIADGKVELIEITHEGIGHLSGDTEALLWKNVSWLLLRKLAVSISRESLDE